MARPLEESDLAAYTEHFVRHMGESGRDGDSHFGPYSRDEAFDLAELLERNRVRWSTPLDAVGWRRAWGIFDDGTIVASAYVAGAGIESSLHRVTLGISVLRAYRRRGMGEELLSDVVSWCRERPEIDWLDLGVFGGNLPAQAFFRKHGFRETGRVADLFRVDGVKIDDIAMTMSVSG